MMYIFAPKISLHTPLTLSKINLQNLHKDTKVIGMEYLVIRTQFSHYATATLTPVVYK
jgi:hypothetical protein